MDSYLRHQQFLNTLEVLKQVFGNALLMTPKPSLKSLLECISQNSGLLDFNMKTEQHTETLTYIPHYPYLKKLMMPECIKLSWIQASSEKENWTPRAIYPSKLWIWVVKPIRNNNEFHLDKFKQSSCMTISKNRHNFNLKSMHGWKESLAEKLQKIYAQERQSCCELQSCETCTLVLSLN